MRSRLSAVIRARLDAAAAVTDNEVAEARAFRLEWQAILAAAFECVELLALPTVGFFPPRLEAGHGVHYTALTLPVNLAGLPALALPVPSGGPLPASLQLVGGPQREADVLATGAVLEAAAASLT